MSGPKCTNYRLQEQRRRELERKRLQQEKQKNLQILTKLKQRINSYQYLQENQKNQLLAGIKNAEKETQKDKYLAAQKLIQGIKLYLDALERNQQADDPEESNTTVLRVLKSRYTGDVGLAGRLLYDRETGRLNEVIEDYEEDGSDIEFDDYA